MRLTVKRIGACPLWIRILLLLVVISCNPDHSISANAFSISFIASRSCRHQGSRLSTEHLHSENSRTSDLQLHATTSEDSSVQTNTKNNTATVINTKRDTPPSPSNSTTPRVVPPAEFKIQNKLEEMRERHKTSNLTQEYCDSMLAACVAHDEWDSVLDVLDIMKQQGRSQVHSTYRACLQACFENYNAASAKEILNAMQQAGVTPDGNDIDLVVATMCRMERSEKGWWRQALALVQSNEGLSTAAYDAVLSCMVDERQWKEAIRLLRRMEQGAAEPALSTYRTVIECCAASYQPEQAVQVLQSCVHRGLVPTVYAFELVISALSKKLQWRRAMQILDLMDRLKVPKTIQIYNTVLAACSKAREVVQAKNLLVQMRKNGIQPDIFSFNSVISVCAGAGRWKDALNVLDQCHREPGVEPDIYTYTNAMRACAKGGKTRKALTLLQVVKDKRLPLDAYAYTAVIEACAKAGMWRKALELLDEMDKNGIAPSDVTYSVTITACGNGGQWEKALEILETMREKNLSINLITYNAAITAISKAAKQSAKSHSSGDGQLWKTVMKLLDQIRADGLEPDGFSFSSAISCCGAEGRWEEALELIALMQNGGPRTRPNKIAYTAAISSCGRNGQVDHALRLFRQMRDQGLSADRVAYNALFNALRVAKRADAAYELWGEMVGTRQSNTTKIATAKADRSTTPDIITVTDAIGSLSSAEDTKEARSRVDEVFVEAVRRGIVLRDDTLDHQWEIDLTGMSFPVARAACRYLINTRVALENSDCLKDLALITGVGSGKGQRRLPGANATRNGDRNTADDDRQLTTLREYVQDIFLNDFEPPIVSHIPKRAQGTVQVDRDVLSAWMDHRIH